MDCISALTGTIIIIIIITIIIIISAELGYWFKHCDTVTVEQSSLMLIQEKTYNDHGFCI